MYKLINAAPSPYGRKVAVALLEKGLTFQTIYDVPWSDETCTPLYSPLEQLPILLGEAGEKIYASTYILDWLEARHPHPPLLPSGVDGHGRHRLGDNASRSGIYWSGRVESGNCGV